MKRQMLIGMVLIVFGVALLLFELVTKAHGVQATKPDPLQMTGEKEEVLVLVPFATFVGTISLAAGIFVTVLGSRKA